MTEELPCFDRDKVRTSRYPYFLPAPNDSSAFESAIARIMWVLNVGTLSDLSAALGVQESLINEARRCQIIPAAWLVHLQLQWNINILWILTGYIPPVTRGTPAPEELKRIMSFVR